VDSRWTPENYLDSGGVHLEYVGEGKVYVGLSELVGVKVVLEPRGRCRLPQFANHN
jgi:hypothetical protein